MNKIYTLLFSALSFSAAAQQTISFESTEGYQLGTIHQQNGWEVTEGSDGFITNQVITADKATNGSYSFKNAFEPSFDFQWFPIFGAVKTFDQPMPFNNFTISYDVQATAKLGSDFEFVIYAIDANELFIPVAGVGIENRGFIYFTTDENYGFEYATSEWTPNQWINVKIEVTTSQVKYYINNVLELTIDNFSQSNIAGFNMLHNNYGHDAYYDNIVITSSALSSGSFDYRSAVVYPNPSEDFVTLLLPANISVSVLEIYTITGQKVLQTTQKENIDISQLANGTYVLKAATTDGTNIVKKIIKT